jgi:ubiquinone/menaquinone biosynthesis C-methylase UbiE/DNA-directed RNA polymerase subunit RPC12/RpoP
LAQQAVPTPFYDDSMTPKPPPVIDYEGSTYQSSFWEKGGREYEDRVEAVAMKRLLPQQGELLLEVGAGAGRNTPRYRGYKRVVLLDYARSQLAQAQERLGTNERYVYVAADAYRLPFVPGLFDAATMIRTIHHMADVSLALAQVRQVLKPGAVFILEFANKQNLKSILRYLLRRQTWNPFTEEPVEFAALNFDFHPRHIQNTLKSQGFTIERKLTVSHYRVGLLKKVIPTGILVGLDSIAQFTGNWWQLTPSVFVRSTTRGEFPPEAESGFFRCIECGQSPLEENGAKLTCIYCGKQWLIKNGIYDFRD